MKKKKNILIISIVAAVAILAGVGLGIFAHYYGNQNHADQLDKDGLFQYNYVLTAFGRNSSLIGSNDVLIVESVSKSIGSATEITFVIYQYTSESALNAALYMTPEEIADNANYIYMGTGTVSMEGDDFSTMQNMKTTYVR